MTGFIPVAGRGFGARSVDDLALSHVSAHNVVSYDYVQGVYRTKATALVFIKSLNNEIVCPPPSHVFNGEPWGMAQPYPLISGINSYIWFKHFPLMTDLNTMRKVVAREALDYLYKRWHGDEYPFIAARLGLLDWQTGVAVDPTALDSKYSEYGLFKQLITRTTMLHNGITSGIVDHENEQNKQYRYGNDARFDTAKLTGSGLLLLLRDYGINLEELVRTVWDNTYFNLKKWTTDKPQAFQTLSKQLGQFLINPDLYVSIVDLVQLKLKDDNNWRQRFLSGGHPKDMVRDLIYLMVDNYVDQTIVQNNL